MFYIGSNKITPAIFSTGGTTELIVINHSSFDRQLGEKVFLNQITGGWEIINYASADINSITAKCLENIAKNSTGMVSLAIDGALVNHEVRDFTLGSNLSESNINDESKLVSTILNQNNKHLVGNNINYTYNDFRIKFKFKFIPANSEVTTFIPFDMDLFKLNYTDDTSISQTYNLPKFGINYNNYNKNFYCGIYTGGTPRGPLLPNEEYLVFDNWITMEFLYEYNTKYGTLKISDGLGHYDEVRTYVGISSSYSTIYRCLFGNMFISNQPNVKLVLDLNNIELTTLDGNTIIWKPYKEINN